MVESEDFVARSRRETPRRSLRCRLGLHWWTSLNWRGSSAETVARRRVERHCCLCGRLEIYLLDLVDN